MVLPNGGRVGRRLLLTSITLVMEVFFALILTSEYTHCVYSPYITIDCPFYIHFKKLRYIVEKMVK